MDSTGFVFNKGGWVEHSENLILLLLDPGSKKWRSENGNYQLQQIIELF